MATHAYTMAELERLWVQAGGPKGQAKMAAAIALAESHGDPTVDHHNSNGTTDRGLWQINSVHTRLWGPQLRDPLANARAAVAVYNAQGFKAWTTFRNGAVIPFLSGRGGKSSLGDIPITPRQVTQAVSGASQSVTGVAQDVERFAVKESVVALSYLLLTGAALALFVLGALRATGTSPLELAAAGAKARTGGKVPY